MTISPLARAIRPASAAHRPACTSRAHRAALVLALAAGLLFAATPATATMYKWVDKNGRIFYSDQPPPANIKSDIVKPPPPPANPNAAKEFADKELQIKLREKQRVQKAAADEKTQAQGEGRRANCTQARGQLQGLLRANQQYYRYDERGERAVLDDSGRATAIEQQQQIIRENCGN